jgi:hypothetical protein
MRSLSVLRPTVRTMTDEPPTDPVMARILAAVGRSQAGDAEGARTDFAAVWADIGPDGDPFHRCTLAHYAADAQDDLRAELAWDEIALEAAAEVTDARAQEHHGSLVIEGFFPSLHLNLAEDHRRLGDLANARHHIDEARRRLSALPEDGYGAMIRAGVDRVAALLEGA